MKHTIQQFIESGYVIEKTTTENPYREGTKRYKRFEAYRTGRGVEATLADKRVKRDGFRHDVNAGIIKLVRKH